MGLAIALNERDMCMEGEGWTKVSVQSQSSIEQPKPLAVEEWDAARQSCKEEAEENSERSGISFPNAFDACMKKHGL